ncbi:hypothetical protein GC089_15340 [Cellulomonas sp. JZ18]|uniref:hypothetical protein n=1 Tax=Cellulomonas sp. JZ18 TaxID=2654191 RepID=UPI0012D472A2|nr:hypothetical protein [Cellulomonas sp. JZ18]QGQ20310.1 hypothetical protein GC089_15340 [Cellulomonas sp. JZ18]
MTPAPDPAGTVAAEGWDGRWEHALHELELDVADAERLLAAAHLPDVEEVTARRWRPPVGLGPLPAPLRERAQALLEHQLDLARRTAEAMTLARRQLAAADAMRTRPSAVPVFVDTQA